MHALYFSRQFHSLMICCFFVEFLFAEYTKDFKLKRRDSSGFNKSCSDTDSQRKSAMLIKKGHEWRNKV